MSVLRVSSVTAGLASIVMMALAFASSPAHASVRPQTAVHTTTLDVQGVQRDRTSLSAGPHVKIVVSGNTLSGIAEQKYGNPACWPGVYNANKKTIGPDPNVIRSGERLILPAACDTTPPAEMTAVVKKTVPQTSAASATHESVSVTATSSFQACVIARESGGNPDIWNATGHWGLYQFSEQTWIAYGGSAAEFGHASAAEQTRIFDNAMATSGGADNWAPYDGC
jgi:LysM repeat protein